MPKVRRRAEPAGVTEVHGLKAASRSPASASGPGLTPRTAGVPRFAFHDDGVAFLRGLPEGRGVLGDEPGLGKSRQALLAAEGRTLILAPAMVLDGGVWSDELAKWRPDLDATCVPYTSLCSRERTDKGGTRPTDRAKPELAGPWDTLILDEAHYIKGRKTTWTSAIERLRFDRGYLLTGTPIPNWAYELFIPLRICHPGEAKAGKKYGSYWRWAKEWFDVTPSFHGGPQAMDVGGLRRCGPECAKLPGACEHWAEFHDANLGGVFLQRLRDDVLSDLPPLTEQTVKCRLTPAQRKAYAELKREFVTYLESGAEVVSWSKSGVLVKLCKVVTGLETLDRSVHASSKLDALRERVAHQAQPSLVVAHFRDSCEVAAEALRGLGKAVGLVHGGTGKAERLRAVRGLQSGELDVLVGSLDTIGEGLTLHRADTVHFLERSWRPSRNIQALRRIHRIGQERPCTAYFYEAPDTYDQRIVRVLATKTDQQMRALRPRDVAALL